MSNNSTVSFSYL